MRCIGFFSLVLIGAWLCLPIVSSAQTGPDKASIQKVVDEICSDGGAWLKCYSLEPSKCRSVTAGFVEPCVGKVMAAQGNNQGMQMIERLLTCFNQEFMSKYGAGEIQSPECKNPMAHLARN